MKTKTLSKNRYNNNIHEREALRYFYQAHLCNDTMRNTIISTILYANPNFGQDETKEQNEFGKKVRKNIEFVEQILDTLFQWFGTSVGSSLIKEMINSIDSAEEFEINSVGGKKYGYHNIIKNSSN